MIKRFQFFIRGVSTNWIGTTGVVLTTSAFFLFIFFELLRITGSVTNAYVGLISYLVLPTLFLLGLILIPIGWFWFKKKTGQSTEVLLKNRFPEEMVRTRGLGSNLVGIISLLTVVNLMFLGLGGARMLHFMDEPFFCGTACHQVMNPEWVTYQNSPHAHVRCVDCHVGEGTDALIDAKLNGMWQIISATFHLYEKPIPTPVHNLRPARETCEKCHWPEKFYGSRIKTLEKYNFDAASSRRFTTLSLKVGSGKGEKAGTIHWHVAEQNEVRYQPTDYSRLKMAWVEVRKENSYHRYTNRREERRFSSPREQHEKDLPPVRTLDCIDCHNRATHIYEDPEAVVDTALASGQISRDLPFAKKVALGAVLNRYAGKVAANTGISNAVRGHYIREAHKTTLESSEKIDRMIASLQWIYERNIHPEMNIGWKPYPSHIGHEGKAGCFRCHNPDFSDQQGRPIPYDCTLCHSILAYDSEEPFKFLQPPADKTPDRTMHIYLREEFLKSAD